MDDEIDVKGEITNLRKEINDVKNENNELRKVINDQSLEIQKLKEDYNKDKNEMLKEIEKLKENINLINSNKDNAPPLCFPLSTPLSSKNSINVNTEQITKTGGETVGEKGKYITSLCFYSSNSIDLCIAQLLYYGYEHIEGDIRKDAGGLFCILGCKYEKGQPYITNIVGSVSDREEPAVIFENGIKYIVVKDPLNNADIHKGSGGNYFCLYITKDPKAGKPIKGLKTLSTREFLKGDNIVKYCSRKTKYNKPFEPLDCNRGRDSIIRFTPQNYIFIERD